MNFDHSNDLQDRITLLEEIRQRAEAAELARIEAEEARLVQTLSSVEDSQAEDELRSIVDQTSSSNLESGHIETRDSEYGEIHSLSSQEESHGEERIAELLLSAQLKYEHEDYDQALRDLDRIAALDPDHNAAVAFRLNVEKAKTLSERLVQEEVRRKIEEKQREQEFVPRKTWEPERDSPLPQGSDKENRELQNVPVSHERRRAKRSFAVRILSVLGTTMLALLGVGAVFVVLNQVRVAYFPPKAGLLVLPPRTSGIEAHVAEGLTEDLLLHLSHVRSVSVFSSRTSRSLPNGREAATAQLLGADYVVEWRIEGSGETIGISMSLIETSSQRRLLEYSSGGMIEQLPEWCNDAATRIASAINADATGMQAAFMTSSVKPEAYASYLLGRSLLREPRRVSLDSIAVVFSQACLADPSFPYADAMLGWTHILRHAATQEATSSYLEAAQQSLHRAMNLGGGSAEVYRLWGVIDFFKKDFEQSQNRLEQAARIAESDVETQHWLVLAYLRTGRNEDALRVATAAVEKDPYATATRSLLATTYLFSTDAKSALREFEFQTVRKSRELADEYLAALVGTNNHERATNILKARTEAEPGNFIAAYDLGRMYQLAGKSRLEWEKVFNQALKLLDDTIRTHPEQAMAHSYRGLIYTRLGRFSEGISSNARAMSIAPSDVYILYNASRLYALQRHQSQEAEQYFVKAINKRFLPSQVLDLDLTRLCNSSNFRGLLTRSDTAN